jgi:hypothetical protein
MLYRLRNYAERARFAWQCKEVWKTPPIRLQGQNPLIVTRLSHKDLLLYLTAIKSFYRHVGKGSVMVLSDGSVTPGDMAVLEAHVPGIRVAQEAAVENAACPRGGCWERLLFVADRISESFFIQLDSDTMTTGPMPEVLRCVEDNCSFTLLGHGSHPEVENVVDFVRNRPNPGTHIQSISETNMDKLPNAAHVKYLRGNAGFVGYAKGSFSRAAVEAFSSGMAAICGDRWNDWGSEQVTSNLVVANSDQVLPLPPSTYTSYWAEPGVDYSAARFIHFMGTKRFANGAYAEKVHRFLKGL